jgi:hypothetical protein
MRIETMSAKIEIGTVIRGTLRTQNLLTAFAKELARLNIADPDQARKARHEQLLADIAPLFISNLDDWTREQEARANYFINEPLFDALNEHAPDYVYFGYADDDGLNFGWWPAIETLKEDCESGEVLRVSDLSEVPTGHNGLVCYINDHGNVSLYSADNGKLAEVWSCV